LIDYIIVFIYLSAMLIYGFISSKKISSLKDFALSDKRYGCFIIFATLSASFIGGGFSFGNAAKVYQSGIGYCIALLGFSLKEILTGKIIAPKMQNHKDVISTGGIIQKSFGIEAKLFTGFLSVILCGGMLGAQVGAMGYIFEALIGIDKLVGIFLGCAIVVFYSTTGGMKAVIATDIIQFIILFLGIPITLIFGIIRGGGITTIIQAVPHSHFDLLNGSNIWDFIGLFLTFMLGEALIPPYTQRLLIAKDSASLKKATILSGLVSIPFFLISGLIGIVSLAIFPNINPNTALPILVKSLPIIINGFVISGLISVVMSSADSILNSAATAMVEDIIGVIYNSKRLSDKTKLKYARTSNILTAIIAIIVALLIPNLLDILMIFYTIWAPAMLVPIILSVFGYKGNKQIFFACALTGICSAIIIRTVFKPQFSSSYLIVSIILSYLVIILLENSKPKSF